MLVILRRSEYSSSFSGALRVFLFRLAKSALRRRIGQIRSACVPQFSTFPRSSDHRCVRLSYAVNNLTLFLFLYVYIFNTNRDGHYYYDYYFDSKRTRTCEERSRSDIDYSERKCLPHIRNPGGIPLFLESYSGDRSTRLTVIPEGVDERWWTHALADTSTLESFPLPILPTLPYKLS